MLLDLHRRLPLRLLAGALALSVALPAGAIPIQLDSNPRYLNWNGSTLPLIGFSGEFLPHVARTAGTHPSKECVYTNYTTCLQKMADHGLNKMQVWISLNSSVGIEDQNTTGFCTAKNPYPGEQPFFWNGSRWNLDRYDTTTFFPRLNEVISAAAAKGIIVEVVLFANSYKQYCTSPWYPTGRNIGTSDNSTDIHFTDPKYFTMLDQGLDGVLVDDNDFNEAARKRQVNLVKFVVQQLNGHSNLYYQLANEPDQSPADTTAVDIKALVNWHLLMAKTIYETENPPNQTPLNQHLIGVNLWSKPALDQLLAGQLKNYVHILNGHYVRLIPKTTPAATPNTPLYGALGTIRSYFASFPRAFGFNETKSSWDPNFVGARAEAWEFMLGEGGIYDNYNLDVFNAKSGKVFGYLNFLRQFLAPLTLTNFGRQTGSTPAWISGLQPYPADSQAHGLDGAGLGNPYWSAMQWTRNQYALYIHHSSIPDPQGNVSRFKRYAPCYKSTGYQHTNLSVNLGTLPGAYYADWFVPGEAAPGTTIQPVCRTIISWNGTTPVGLSSPRYAYDLALRIQRCSSATSCPPAISCASVTPVLPPADPEPNPATPSCSPGV